VRAAFFDRDGVLNVDAGFVFRPEDFVWRETAIETVAWLNARGVKVFVVTNQSGVARGFYGEDDVRRLHDHMQAALRQAGAHVDAFRFCPHHPEAAVEAFRIDCACRKPRSGMIEDLLAEWSLAPAHCQIFGDRETQMDAARGAGVRGVLVAHDLPLIEIVRAALG
jgi:D-glycero-D-manno-heptose 1,7-bisphosphate phosphatase